MSQQSPPDAIFGIFSTYALDLADRHGILARLISGGPAGTAEVAVACGTDPDTTERLMVVLASVGVLDRDGTGRFQVVPSAVPYLDPADPHYVGGFVRHLITNTAGQLALLDRYLTEGKAAVDEVRPEPFEGIYRDEESTSDFLRAMWQLSYEPSRSLVRLASLDDVRRLVDVGGASGAFAVAALDAYPGLSVTVFDLPQVGPHLEAVRRERGLAERLDFVAGDFFRDPLPAAQCLSFGYILSDWADDTCVELLAKAFEACAPGGRVLVLDRLFDDDGGPLATAVMNLSMHVETRGRHRRAAEYVALLRKAGFVDCTVRLSDWDKHLVTGRRP